MSSLSSEAALSVSTAIKKNSNLRRPNVEANLFTLLNGIQTFVDYLMPKPSF